MPAANYLSAAALSQKTAAALDSFKWGETEKLEDIHFAALVFARLKTFKPDEAVSHNDMMRKFLLQTDNR